MLRCLIIYLSKPLRFLSVNDSIQPLVKMLFAIYTKIMMSNTFDSELPDQSTAEPLEIPFEQLSEQALNGVLEEYITREGTDYGMVERSVESQLDSARALLTSGKVVIVFDEVSERCQIVESRLLKSLSSDEPEGDVPKGDEHG